MSDSTQNLDTVSQSSSQPAVQVNNLLDAASPATLFGRRASQCAGLVFAVYGGRYNGTSVSNTTVTATASNTNYVVVHRSTLAVSVSTSSTNWNDTATYGRAYKLTAGTDTISSYEDHRAGSGGILNPGLVPIAAHTFLGNNTGSTATPSALTATQLTAELNAVVGDSGSGGTKGLVPAPAAGDAAAGKFLKADGTWAAGGAISTVSNSDGTLTISPTTGAVVASLNLGHANTWTAKQTFQTVSASANSAPIYLPNGSSGMTTPEAGAIEVFGNQPYYTVSGPTRKSIVLTESYVSGGIAVMTADGRLSGTALLTWNGSAFNIPGTLTVSGLTTINSGVSPGQIPYISASNTIVGNANLAWDNANVRLGIGQPTLNTDLLSVKSTANARTAITIDGANNTGCYACFSTATDGVVTMNISSTGSSWTPTGIFSATSNHIDATQSGGLNIVCSHGSGALRIATGGSTASNERLRIDNNGNVVVSLAALATNATNGFLYIPGCAGTPTGTPTSYSGRVPLVADTTNNKVYARLGGAWVALN